MSVWCSHYTRTNDGYSEELMSCSPAQLLISREQIHAAIQRLATAIQRDYATTPPLLIGTLKGAFIFLADLVRALDMHVEIAFVQLASYGSSTVSSGHIEVIQPLPDPIHEKHVLIIEDIVDSGHTVAFLQHYLWQQHPASVRLCTLLDKPVRRQVPVTIDYCGFTIPDVFVVGYGLDWNEQYRHLPDLCVITPANPSLPRVMLA